MVRRLWISEFWDTTAVLRSLLWTPPPTRLTCYDVDNYSYGSSDEMTTIQMTLDEELLKEVDGTVKRLRTTRSALIRDSIRHYLKCLHVSRLEAQDREAYKRKPVRRGEFDIWEGEQVWGDE